MKVHRSLAALDADGAEVEEREEADAAARVRVDMAAERARRGKSRELEGLQNTTTPEVSLASRH